MARTLIAAVAALGAYPSLPVAANALDAAFTALDVANKNYTPLTGKELLVFYNSDGANPYTATITSIADALKRTGDIGPYTMQAGEYAVAGPFSIDGWRQTDGNLYFEGNNAAVKVLVIRLP